MSDTPMPSYNPEWTGAPNVSAPEQPKQVRWAFWLLLAAAVIQAVAAIFGLVQASSPKFRQQVTDSLAKQNVGTQGHDAIGIAVAFATGAIIVTAVVAIILYVLIGMFINKGHGWARITGLVLAAVSLTRLISLTFPAGIFTILQVLAGIAAIVLCFIKPGSQFFIDTKNFRQANKIQ